MSAAIKPRSRDAIELPIHVGGTPPLGESGYFVVWQRLSDRPLAVWWSTLQTDWRDGGRLIQVEAWAGPLPRPIRWKAS